MAQGVDLTHVSDRREFARALALLRDQAELSVREVSRLSGIPASTLGGYFGGAHLPWTNSAHHLMRVLAVCGVTDASLQRQWRETLLRIRSERSTEAARSIPANIQ
jgi:transcriptional regulator with XRE-family HTH domain